MALQAESDVILQHMYQAPVATGTRVTAVKSELLIAFTHEPYHVPARKLAMGTLRSGSVPPGFFQLFLLFLLARSGHYSNSCVYAGMCLDHASSMISPKTMDLLC